MAESDTVRASQTPGTGSWRQKVRLYSGLVLFVFAAAHLINHALGLVSVEAMEAMRDVRVAIWRSPPGTVALYGALVLHMVFALTKFVQRRGWRMTAWEAVQLVFGLAIPVLLLRHVMGTRMPHEFFGIDDNYAYALWAMWPGEAYRQAFLILLVWVHGCVGIHFWLALIGFNLTFGPMHILGLNGMPRRTYRYPEGLGWANWNAVATIGAYIILVAFLVFVWNIVRSHFLGKGERIGNDPWDGRTLEWTIPSPPPVHNFDEVPVVHSVDDFWHQKYAEDDEGRAVKMPAVTGAALTVDKATGGEGEGDDEHLDIHMPSPSYYPALSSLGMVILGAGLIYLPWGFIAVGIGAVVTIWGLFGWSLEPVTKEH